MTDEILTDTMPQRGQFVVTSRTSGWIKVRLIPWVPVPHPSRTDR